MGAWGDGVFENDDAADLVGEVVDAAPADAAALVDRALAAVAEPDDPYLEVDVVSRALAAVALLVADRDPAVLAGATDAGELPGVLAAAGLSLDADRAGRARAVVDRALDPADNEWHELWDEADALDGATAPVTRLRALLEGPTRT